MHNLWTLVGLFLGCLILLLVHSRAERKEQNLFSYLLSPRGFLADLKMPKVLLREIIGTVIVTLISQLPFYILVFTLERGDREVTADLVDRNTQALAKTGDPTAIRESIDLRTELLKQTQGASAGSIEERLKVVIEHAGDLSRRHLQQNEDVAKLDRHNVEQFEVMWRPTVNHIVSEFEKWEAALREKGYQPEKEQSDNIKLAGVGIAGDLLVRALRVGKCTIELRTQGGVSVGGEMNPARVFLYSKFYVTSRNERAVITLTAKGTLHAEGPLQTGDPLSLDERGIPPKEFTEFFHNLMGFMIEHFLVNVSLDRATAPGTN